MDSIYDILHRFDAIAEDIGAEQRAVRQLPALFRPPQTSPQLSGPYPGQNATRGYLVGEGEEDSLEEIDRRGFLKGMGAAAVAGAAGYELGKPNIDTSVYKNPKAVFLIGYLHAAKEHMPRGKETLEINSIIEDYLAYTKGNAMDLHSGSAKFFNDVGAYNKQHKIGRPGYTEVFDDDIEQKKWIQSQGREALNQLKGLTQKKENVNQDVVEGDVVAFSKAGMTAVTDEADYKEKRDKIYRLLSQPGVDAETKAAAKEQLKTLDLAARNAGVITEETATEDVLSAMKKKLGDYFQDVATAIKTDPDLKDKIPQTVDQLKAVKTIRTDDGKEIKITGNEDDGFRISIRNQEIRTPFKTLDEATMACEMYCARRRMAEAYKDYLDEA